MYDSLIPENGLFSFGDGTFSWWKNGKIHRDDGPAIEGVSGAKSWYQNGKLHRDDGPAIEFADGTFAYYFEDIKLNVPHDKRLNKEQLEIYITFM